MKLTLTITLDLSTRAMRCGKTTEVGKLLRAARLELIPWPKTPFARELLDSNGEPVGTAVVTGQEDPP